VLSVARSAIEQERVTKVGEWGWQGKIPKFDTHIGHYVAGPEDFLTAEQTPTVSDSVRHVLLWLNA
jgi:hypothetical protein